MRLLNFFFSLALIVSAVMVRGKGLTSNWKLIETVSGENSAKEAGDEYLQDEYYPGELYDHDFDIFPAACLETPGDSGICKAKSSRWTFIKDGYNTRDPRTCEQFNYGGCGGNSNRFDTEQICENVCKHQNTKKKEDEDHACFETPGDIG